MTPHDQARAALALSILDAIDQLKPGHTLTIAREPHAPFGGLVVVTKEPKKPQRTYTAKRAIDVFAAALLGRSPTPMTAMSGENADNSEGMTSVSYQKPRDSKKP